ncbi:DMT family transporter [Francisella adeliensis]|uniref:EamA family transporter n=1 Tax=Francisella adeliensis TaxID=2007306 RepID=A0A2Z4XW42_9GAMM|nr:EamA family transporter [Francisella adeliensis]AXA32900.1 hypothetical protein CDH04_00015 [Francisella adeliensis]MBK2086399.1 EamA family transporter [Francisella adeliensis]MBK2096614.1 EamA family transporter [Francisella adeliensis]QIW11126.1 EamA family transporter [Francisella adeliensis]QIW13003.1 EamA family transporter [Francisella adeliensis]
MIKKYSFLLAIGMIWGSQFVFQKEAIEHFPAILIAISRSFIGCILLCGVCYFMKIKSISNRRNILMYSIIALLEATIPFMLIPWGQQFTSTSITAVLTGTVPFFVVIFGPLIIRSRITIPNILSITVGFIGLLILFYPDLVNNEQTVNFYGIAAILLATICFALAILLLSKSCSHENPIIVSRNILIASSIQLSVVALVFAPYDNITPTGASIASLIYLGVACAGIVYYLYSSLIKLAGPVFTSFTNYLVPLFGVILGILINNDPSSITVWISLIIILSAISLNYISRH